MDLRGSAYLDKVMLPYFRISDFQDFRSYHEGLCALGKVVKVCPCLAQGLLRGLGLLMILLLWRHG